MTWALCTNCGNFKLGPYLSCEKCNCGLTGKMGLDALFNDHSFTERTLREFGQVIQALRSKTNDEDIAFWAFVQHVSDQYPEAIYSYPVCVCTTIPQKYRISSRTLISQSQLPEVFVEDNPRLINSVESLDPINRYQSHVRHHKIECESCGHLQSFAVWSRIDGSSNPWVKTLINTGRLFINHCRRCGHQQNVAYETLYLDIEKLLAIWLRNSGCKPKFKIKLPPQDYFDDLTSDFTFRVVSSPAELAEKIVVFADGYDDLLIEFIKLCVSIQNGIDLAAPLTYFWTSRKFFFGGTMHFLPPDSSQVIKYSFWLQKANAVQVIAKLQPTLLKLKDSWISVNRQFLVKVLEETGLMRHIDV